MDELVEKKTEDNDIIQESKEEDNDIITENTEQNDVQPIKKEYKKIL